jgi:uncharacterized protein
MREEADSSGMQRWLKVCALFALAVVLLSLLNFALAVHPYRFTSDTNPGVHGVEYESVRFPTSDGLILAGWFVPGAIETEETIIIGHGYPFDKGDVLSTTLFLYQRYNLLYYDHRYFGESEGSFTSIGLRETKDVVAALDYLEARGLDGPVGGLGFSFSASVMLMTDDERLDALVAEAPYASLELMVNEQYRFLVGPLKYPFTGMTAVYSRAMFGAWPSQVSPAEAVRDTDRPTLLIHGTDDTQIPFSHAEHIMERASASVELWEVPGGDHGGIRLVAGDEWRMRVVTFFEANLGEPTRPPGQEIRQGQD